MILGLGIDIIEVARVQSSVERFGDRFLNRVLLPDEIAYCTDKKVSGPFVAVRFAAKEATMKALGTGHSRGVLWKDIEVFRQHGPPQLRLTGGARRRFDVMQARRSLLTLTHSDALAMAQVLLLDD